MRKLLVAVLIGGLLGWVVVNSRSNEEQPPAPDQQQTAEQSTPEGDTKGMSTEEDKQTSYRYTAQRGDSYTKMARKAIQAYTKQHNLTITPAGIIFAETNLTKLAGSPRLEIGQQVEFAEEALKQWAEKAQTLTAAQQTAWNRYVPSVNFDTSHVGVAQ